MSFPSRKILFLSIFAVLLVLVAGTVVTADDIVDASEGLESDQANQSPPVMIHVDNSSNYLSPAQENITKETYSDVPLDVSGAVESDALRLHGGHQERILEERLENADEGERVELQTVRRLEENALALEQEQRQLLQAYNEGTVETSTLMREVVSLGVTAEQYRDLSATVQEKGSHSDSVGLLYSNLDGELALLPSPLVSHLESGLEAGGQTPMYVQSGNDSLVFATVVGDTYLREAVMYDQRDRISPEQFGAGDRSEADDAFARAEQLYPWALSDAFNPELRGFGNSSVYQLQADHSHGELQTYIDGATTNPFYEVQEKDPRLVPVSDFRQSTDDGLRLDIQLTAATGPMRVEVIEAGDVTADNITVSVGNDPVRVLESGGAFHTVQPKGTFEITAEADTGEEVSILVFP